MDTSGSQAQPSYLDKMPTVDSSSSPGGSSLKDSLLPESSSNGNGNSSISPAKSFTSSSSPRTLPVPRQRDLRRQFVRIFVASLGILQLVKAIGALIKVRKCFTIRSSRLSDKTYLEGYKVHSDAHSVEKLIGLPSSIRESKFIANILPILVLGPLANLLPANIITQLNLYAVCAAGMACARVLNDRVDTWLAVWQSKADEELHRIKDNKGRTTPYVPYYMKKTSNGDGLSLNKHFSFLDDSISSPVPVGRTHRLASTASLAVAKTLWKAISSGGGWWLFPLTQGLLLDTAVFEDDCFPGSYRNVIVAVSDLYGHPKRIDLD
ncbi:hypothetical protein QFC19_001279 [Naganishia cerealis]|uniref:Uncharacterized protein n=1 Tax=Naganishia cerealis TaxID=610337 RepID=A0ACC2WI57_9TREE|nr:hypothetical protein QFC19_001279 [Naganishia cerealis]